MGTEKSRNVLRVLILLVLVLSGSYYYWQHESIHRWLRVKAVEEAGGSEPETYTDTYGVVRFGPDEGKKDGLYERVSDETSRWLVVGRYRLDKPVGIWTYFDSTGAIVKQENHDEPGPVRLSGPWWVVETMGIPRELCVVVTHPGASIISRRDGVGGIVQQSKVLDGATVETRSSPPWWPIPR